MNKISNTSKKIFIITFLFFAFLQTGCSSLMYGEEHLALPSKERNMIKNVNKYLQFPNIVTDKNILIYFVAFDGTNNDCSIVNLKKERCTIVGEYYKKISKLSSAINAEKYYPGPSGLNAIYCFTCIDTAEEAIYDLDRAFGEPINNLKGISEVRVVVLGFSRGSAIARHFMNIISKKYDTSITSSGKPIVRTVALLYDTVDTYISGNMEIGFSSSTDYMAHIISKDENRKFFPVIRDSIPKFDYENENIKYNQNYIEIELPGAHSDIGGSYLNGVSVYYRAIADRFFYQIGLINEKSYKIPDHSMTGGKHDSRGFIDKIILGTKSQSLTTRKSISVNGYNYRDTEKKEITTRLNEMFKANADRGFDFTTSEIEPLIFRVKKNKSSVQIYSITQNITQLFVSEQSGEHIINYQLRGEKDTANLKIPKELYRVISSDRFTKIEIVQLEGTDYKYYVYFADDKEVLRKAVQDL